MPIPPDIDPFRVLALCYGIRPPSLKKRDRKASLDAACGFLELTPEQRDELGVHLERLLESLTGIGSSSGEGWLELPERVDRLPNLMRSAAPLLTTIFNPKIQSKLDTILERPRIPKHALEVLFPVLLARASRTPEDPACRPREFCTTMLAQHPAAFKRAVLAYRGHAAAAEHEANPAASDPLPLHQISRILARLERAEEFKERPREAIDAALHAWSGAFESIIYNTSLFLWYLSRPLSTPPEKFIPPQGAAGRATGARGAEPKKGPVFQQARDGCLALGIDFPFYPKLDKLRHSNAHEDYTLAVDRVELRGMAGVVDTLSIEDLVSLVKRDILFAHFFPQGLTEAENELHERSPAVEAAWQAAIALLPELVHTDAPRKLMAKGRGKLREPASTKKPKGKDKKQKKRSPATPKPSLLPSNG